MRFYLATLGCKVNQYESHALREAWSVQGCLELATPESADVILVNSCAVTARAVADVRNTVRRLHRAAPQASIIVTGCAAEVLAKDLADLPGVSAVIGQSRKEDLIEGPLKQPAAAVPQPEKEIAPLPPFPAFSVTGYDRSRAVLKVQDGCSHRCAYCIVPLARGRARSRDMQESLNEAKQLLASGFREIVISGINLRQYGRDFTEQPGREMPAALLSPSVRLASSPTAAASLLSPSVRLASSPTAAALAGCDFWDLLALLDRELSPEWAGQARLRISSLEPGQLGQKALDVLGASRMAVPHLHLALQSGSPSVLRRMGRGHYDPAALPEFLDRLRAVWPVFGLGADILTAFPGESEAEFQEGLALCRSLPLTYAHVFPYSRRPGTAAASMDGQLPAPVKKERAAVLKAMAQEKQQEFLRSLLALPWMRVVFEPFSAAAGSEGANTEQAHGVNEFYADCRLDASESAPSPRVLTLVRPLRVEGGALAVSASVCCIRSNTLPSAALLASY